MRTRLSLVAALLVGLISVLLWGQRNLPAQANGTGPMLDAIRAEQIGAHLRYLSSDLMEGRAPATRGGTLAAEYLATQLALLGYGPAGDDKTCFQTFSVVETTVDHASTLSVADTPLKFLDDTLLFSGIQEPTTSASGEVVFVGHGIVAPEYRWNDYEGVDMRGKVALIMVNDPPAPAGEPTLFGGPALTYYGRWTYKYEEAARQGAVGAILIHTDASATYPWQVVQTGWGGTQYAVPTEAGTPVLALKAWVTDASAKAFVARAGKDLDALRRAAEARGAKPVPLGIQARASITQKVDRKSTANVIGFLRGASLPNQPIVYTAHYDHLGMREARPDDPPNADRIYNGAIDNASGVSGVLEIAESFARARTRPARSIYILFTAAEESGLLGSEYFASHLPIPAAQWAANINIDSINVYGPSKDIVLIGAERSSLGPIATQIAQRHGRRVASDPEPGRGYFFRSDHFPLAKVGIPAVSLSESTEFTGPQGADRKKRRDAYNDTDYHQPGDEMKPDWDLSGAVEDMRFFAELGWTLANSQTMPAYNSGEQFAAPRAGGER